MPDNYDYRIQTFWARNETDVVDVPHGVFTYINWSEWGFVNTSEGEVFQTHRSFSNSAEVLNINGLKHGLYVCTLHVNWPTLVAGINVPTNNVFAQYIGNGYGFNDSFRYGYTPYDTGGHTSTLVSGYPGVDAYNGTSGLPNLPNFSFYVFQRSGVTQQMYQNELEITYFGAVAGKLVSMYWEPYNEQTLHP